MKANKGGHWRVFLTRLMAVTLASVVIYNSLTTLKIYTLYSDLYFWAYRVETNEPVSNDTISKLEPSIDRLRTNQVCLTRFVKAGLTLRLAKIDALDAIRDYDVWSESLGNGQTLAIHAIGCAPTDGNLWLRLAMMQEQIAEDPQLIARFLKLSQKYTPADALVISARYRLYERLEPSTLRIVANPIYDDMKILCDPDNRTIRRGLTPPNENLSRIIEEKNPDCLKVLQNSLIK